MSRSIGKVFGTGPYLTSGFDTKADFAGRDGNYMTTEELQRRIAEMFPQASVPQQIQDFAATNTTGINLQNNLTNNAGTYTTESAWGYPNNTQNITNSNYISDEDLLAKMWENVKEFEKIIPYPYIDTKGTITVGPGKNVNTWEEFKNIKSTIADEEASVSEKEKYFYKLRDMSMMVDENNHFKYHNTPAENFASTTPLRISDEESYRLAQNHMTNDLAHVRQQFSDFDSFPQPLKELLLDIQYNTGNLTRQNWPNLYQAIDNRDVNGIVENIHRKDIDQKRNDWAESMAKSIRFK